MSFPLLDQVGELLDRWPRPLRYPANRAAIVAATACAIARGCDPYRSLKLAEAIGQHVLTQRRLDLFLRLPRQARRITPA